MKQRSCGVGVEGKSKQREREEKRRFVLLSGEREFFDKERFSFFILSDVINELYYLIIKKYHM